MGVFIHGVNCCWIAQATPQFPTPQERLEPALRVLGAVWVWKHVVFVEFVSFFFPKDLGKVHLITCWPLVFWDVRLGLYYLLLFGGNWGPEQWWAYSELPLPTEHGDSACLHVSNSTQLNLGILVQFLRASLERNSRGIQWGLFSSLQHEDFSRLKVLWIMKKQTSRELSWELEVFHPHTLLGLGRKGFKNAISLGLCV